jgi:UPF0755 protein
VADGRERTAQEREAARLERERRRIGGADPVPADPPMPAADDDRLVAPAPREPRSTAAADREPDALGPNAPDPNAPDPNATQSYRIEDDPAEVPSGTRRVSRLREPDGGRPRRAPRSVKRRRVPARGEAKRAYSWAGRIGSLIALILAAAVIWFVVELFQPFGTSPHGQVTVVVPAHSGASQIGDLLAHDGVISSSFFFQLRSTLDGDHSSLRAGTYHLQQGMTYSSVLAILTKLPKAARTSELTIAEGHTRQYVAKLLRQQGIKGNYVAATRSSKLLKPQTYGAPKHVPSLEGFLFPDTFSLVDPIKVSVLVDDQLRDFKQRFSTIDLSYAHRKHLSAYDVLTIASLIEAEAASQSARPLVASVIYNRLADNMMLQFDSTARYATGNFTKPLTESQLHSTSPYNTHTHFGLPPTPIDSPGLASIQAAAHPARSDYLYFFAKPCSDSTVFASSYAQFLALLARDKRTHCP